MLEQELQQLGLTYKETKVYLAGLELGSAPVQIISHRAGVNRATTYFIIEQLQKKGLFSYFTKGKKRYFAAAAPESLKNYLNQQEIDIQSKRERLKKILPKLETLHKLAENKPTIRFFEGKEGIKNIQQEVIKSKDKTIESIFCLDDAYELFPPSKKDHRHIMVEQAKGTKFKNLYSSHKNLKFLLENKKVENVRVNHKQYPIKVDIALYEDKVAIASSTKKKKENFGIVIQDKNIVQTLRSLFYLAFQKAKEIEKK